MLNMKYLIIFIIINLCQVILSVGYETKEIDFNSIHLDKLEGSKMKFYSVDLDEKVKDNDILIDARITNTNEAVFEAPVVLVSLKPLPNTDKDSQWVCGQLGQESCHIPNKHLLKAKRIYLGVLCDSCQFTLKVAYIKEENLKDGEDKLFHLKAGDSKIFLLDEFFLTEKNWIQISSFNLRMTQYKMTVQIVDKEKNSILLDVPVTTNWIGGQQATIQPNSSQFTNKYQYRVTLTAIENGVFSIDARSSQSVIQLRDKSLKFEQVKQAQSVCYSYRVEKRNMENTIIIEAKSIKGNVAFTIYPQKNSVSDALMLGLVSEGDLKYELTKEFRKEKNAQNGNWLICAETEMENAFFTIHVYAQNNSEKIKEYKQLLYQLLKKEEMYDLDNIHSKYPNERIHNVAVFRNLLQNEDVLLNENVNTNNATNTDTNSTITNYDVKLTNQTDEPLIHLNGNGMAGLSVFFIFLVPVLIGSMSLMSIFVNTKFLDQPLRIKIMD